MSKLAERREQARQTAEPIPENLTRLNEVAAATGIPTRTLQRWAQEGRVTATKYGKLWYISLEETYKLANVLHPGPLPSTE